MREQGARPLLAGGDGQRLRQVVVPGLHGLGEFAFKGCGVDVRDGLAVRHVHDQVQPGEHRLGEQRRLVDRPSVVGLEQLVLNAQPHRGVVAVARQVHQTRDVAAEPIGPGEQPGLPTLVNLQHPPRDREHLLGVGLEEIVAGIRLNELQQILAAVGVLGETGQLEELVDAAAQQGDLGDRLVVRARSEQADEAVLTDDLAGGVEPLDAHVVQAHGPVHGRARVGLRQNQNAGLCGVCPDLGRQLRE